MRLLVITLGVLASWGSAHAARPPCSFYKMMDVTSYTMIVSGKAYHGNAITGPLPSFVGFVRNNVESDARALEKAFESCVSDGVDEKQCREPEFDFISYNTACVP